MTKQSDRDDDRRERLAVEDKADLKATAVAQAAAAKADAEATTAPTSTFHVVGPGTVFFQGKQRLAGETLELTNSDAISLGDGIAPGPAPLNVGALPVGGRAGKYKVTAFGAILKEGKTFSDGDVVELSAQESLDFADRIVPA